MLTYLRCRSTDRVPCVYDPSVAGRWRRVDDGDSTTLRSLTATAWLSQSEYCLRRLAFVETLGVGTVYDALRAACEWNVAAVGATIADESVDGAWHALRRRWLRARDARGWARARVVFHGSTAARCRSILARGFSLDACGTGGGRRCARDGAYVSVHPEVARRYSDVYDGSMVVCLALGASLQSCEDYTSFAFASGTRDDCVCYHDTDLILPLCVLCTSRRARRPRLR